METEFPLNFRRPIRMILAFFAIVGFLASVVTVLEFFRNDENSALQVTASQHKFLTPQYSGKRMQDGEPARGFSQNLRNEFCEGLDDSEVLRTEYKDLASKFGDNARKAETCKLAQDVEFSARWNGEYSDSIGALYEYEIKNVGNEVAQGIRISADRLNSVQYTRDGEIFIAIENTDDQYFELPDINPNESYSIYAWNYGGFPDLEYRDWGDLPKITYKGSRIDVEFMKPVPDGWFDLYEFLFSLSWISATLFILAASGVVVIAFASVIGPIQMAVTGQSFSEVFSSGGKHKEANDDTKGGT